MTRPDWPRAETFCFAVLPDTQIMTELDPAAYLGEARWLVDNAAALELRLVLHVGDVVNRGRRDIAQWEIAAAAHESLLDAGIPILVAPGNHDYDDELDESRSLQLFNAHVGFARLARESWFTSAYAEDSSENAYALLDGPAGGVLAVTLEFGPRPEVLAWVDRVVAEHPGRSVFIVTHSYLDTDASRTSAQSRYHPRAFPGSADGLDGEQLWQRSLRAMPGLVGVFSGHQVPAPVAFRVDAGAGGLGVLQSYQNWQMQPMRTMARIRLGWWRPSTRQLRLRVVDTRTDSYVHEPGFDVDLVLDGEAADRFPPADDGPVGATSDGGAPWDS